MGLNQTKNYTFLKLKTIFFFKKNIDLFLLSIYFLSLPIAGITSIQSISLGLFVIVFLINNYKNFQLKNILFYKNIIITFFILLALAILSLFFTPDVKETLKEIKSELIRSFIVMTIFFLYTVLNKKKKITYILYILTAILLFHTLINLYIWFTNGMWPYRAGGLLDSGGGERFGIWATYALSISIALLFSKYKYLTIPFIIISILSITANNTRATFLALFIIIFLFLIFFIKNRYFKVSLLIISTISIIMFVHYSKNFSTRYNAHTVVTNLSMITKYSPKKDKTLVKKHKWDDSSVVRLSMWKSVIIYRLQEPFLPQGYGRFIYGKGIKNNFKDSPENLPYKIFPQTHNDFIGTLYSLGLIGLIAFIYFLYYQLKISLKIYQNSKNQSYKIFSIFVFLGTIGFMTSMMFGSFFGDSEVKFFYPLYGILLGIYYKENYKNEKPTLN